MVADDDKVVGIDGKPVDTKGQTPERVITSIKDLLADVQGETYTSFAAILVCPDGLAVVARTIAPGQLNAALGALEYLKYRMCKVADEG